MEKICLNSTFAFKRRLTNKICYLEMSDNNKQKRRVSAFLSAIAEPVIRRAGARAEIAKIARAISRLTCPLKSRSPFFFRKINEQYFVLY